MFLDYLPLSVQTALEKEFAGNPLHDYLWAFIITLIGFTVIKMISKIGVRQIKKLALKTEIEWDDFAVSLLDRNLTWLSLIIAFYAGTTILKTTKEADKIVSSIFVILITFVFIRVFQGILTYYFQIKYFKTEDIGRASIMRNFLIFIKSILWCGAFIFILDNLGFDITTMVTGFGIGGMAIALASQNILSDIFSYFTIFFDKPFQVGDFITVGNHSGTVEHIGIKTTRIRSSLGEQLVYGNADLIKSCIQNYKKMDRRRVVALLGVTYETPPELLKKIPDMLKEIVEPQEGTTFDRAHFKSFGPSSLDFELVYYVESGVYLDFMCKQQEVNYRIVDRFEAVGIDFAYPTQTLYVNPAAA